MPREVLNRPRRRTAHGEMRTERVPKDMHPRPHTREACGVGHAVLHDLLRERLPGRLHQHPRAAQVSVRV